MNLKPGIDSDAKYYDKILILICILVSSVEEKPNTLTDHPIKVSVLIIENLVTSNITSTLFYKLLSNSAT